MMDVIDVRPKIISTNSKASLIDDGTLFDDTSKLMNDTVALFGGLSGQQDAGPRILEVK